MPDSNTEMFAAFDVQSEAFVDLVLSDASGLSFRTSGTWQNYQPGDLRLDGKEIIDVDSSIIPVFDSSRDKGFDRKTALQHAPVDGKASS